VNSWNSHPLGPLYTDFMMWGWTAAPNGATYNLANASPVWGSSGLSIAFTSTQAWGLFAMTHACAGINITGYQYMHFRMRSAAAGSGPVFVYPYQAPWNNPPSAALANYGGDPTNTAWTNYNIPLTAFPGLPSIINWFVFGANNQGVTFYIDDFSLSDTAINP